MNEIKTAALYIRVSTDDQTEYSPDSQIKLCKKYALEHDFDIVEQYIYQEDGISGTNAEKRPQFQKMIATAKQKPKPFDAIIVYSFSRFARNREDSIIYKSMLRKKLGIDVISITQSLSDGKESILMEAIYEAMDEYYSVDLSENSLRGKIEKASRGEHLGNAPLGYKYDKNTKRLYPDKEKIEIVNFIFNEWIKKETSIMNLTIKLNKMGIKTKRGRNWCEGSVKFLLYNPTYIGYTRFTLGGMKRNYNNPDTKLVLGKHEPIISKELWEATQEKLKACELVWFKYKKPHSINLYWLKGLVKCSNCGKNLVMIKRNNDKKRKPFLQCSGYNKKSCSKSHSIIKEKLENAILLELKRIYTDKIDVHVVSKEKYYDESAILKNSIKKCNLRLNRIEIAYMDGIDTLAEYKIKKQKIISEINDIKAQIKNISNKKIEVEKKEKVYSLCEYAHKILQDDKIDFETKEKIANKLFKNIIYNKDEQTIYITFNEV